MVKFVAAAAAALFVADIALAKPAFLPKTPGDAARRIGLYYGTAVDVVYNDDKQYQDLAWNPHEYSGLTPENMQKWETSEPQQGVFNFTNADYLINRALRQGRTPRCHALVWHSQLAPWVESTTWTNETLIAAMTNHITKVAGHFKGRCRHWDVLNEALNDDGTYRDTIFLRTIGPDYIPIAFAAAAKADPFAKLYYNDYNMEKITNKTTAALEKIVKLVKSRGIRIDGIGMQAHRTLGGTPSYADQKAVIETYRKAGLETAYTEIDIRMVLPATPEMLEQQKAEYYNTIRACVDSKRCVGVTVWGISDKTSWIPATFPGQGSGLPIDETYTKKPAYEGILKALTDKKYHPYT